MDMKRILQALDGVSSKPAEGANDMKKFLQIVNEGANPHKVSLPVQMAMQHYQEVTSQPAVKEDKLFKLPETSKLYKYYQVAEQKVTERTEAHRAQIAETARSIAKRISDKKELEEMRSRNPAYMSPSDYERHQQSQMDWEKRDFKRRELEAELGHEDTPEFKAKMRDEERGPWFLKINGKIFKSKGEAKMFDWKKGANNYALAILKNKPELKGKIFLTRKNQDDHGL